MNYDELAFFNQQLASMLRDGIPLEGALKQLCAGMRTGKLKLELQELEADLGRGTPLKDALARRDLPDFYCRMLEIGARGNDLPGMLTLLADHFHQANLLWTRLKGLMVYPALVIVVSLALTLIISLVFSHFLAKFFDQMSLPALAPVIIWIPPIAMLMLALLAAAAFGLPTWRERLRWRLPGFRETSLAQLASAIALMLRKGTTLAEALALAERLEGTSPAARVLGQWQAQVEAGQGKPAQWSSAARPFPPLFLWLIQKSGEDVAAGFEKAAEIYRGRASYRIELALYGALPVSVLFLGQMIFWQVAPLMQAMVRLMNALGDTGAGS